MLSLLTRSAPFLSRLQAGRPDQAHRIEGVLASARAFLAVASLAAIWIDATEPSRYAALAYSLMLFYVFYSFLILAWVRLQREPSSGFRLGIHGIDVLWPAVISLFTSGPNSPFFIFNAFVLLEAAFRWGLRQTLATAGAEVVLYFSGALLWVFSSGALGYSLREEFELNRFIMRGLYLLIMGYLLGYLGEQEKRQRAEASGIARLVVKVQSEPGVRGALRVVLEEVCRLFESKHALLILQEVGTGRAFLWAGRQEKGEMVLTLTELDSSQRAEYLLDPPGMAWHARRRETGGDGALFDIRGLNAEGRAFRNASWLFPDAFLKSHDFESMLGTAVNFRSDWTGSLLVLDPNLGHDRYAAARFLSDLVRQLSPAMYGVYVMRRLRSRAGAVERARVARELHDGVIQSLIGLEMQVDVLRRQAARPSDQLAAELGRIQTLLRQEVLNVRELMQQMKPLELGPKQLLDFLASTVDKFQQDTGISAYFVSPLEEVRLSPRVANEVARIVQEALVNVRKHSRARNVVVRLDSRDGCWKLSVDDDGCGFDFSGRLSQAELDAARKGPVVIKERVRSIGGELAVESIPGRGSSLEILIPQKRYG